MSIGHEGRPQISKGHEGRPLISKGHEGHPPDSENCGPLSIEEFEDFFPPWEEESPIDEPPKKSAKMDSKAQEYLRGNFFKCNTINFNFYAPDNKNIK